MKAIAKAGACRVCGRALKREPGKTLGIGPTCAKKVGYIGPLFEKGANVKAAYTVIRVTEDSMEIRDDSNMLGTMTVTNDAEAVVKDCLQRGLKKGMRLLYTDTDGRLDELVHDGERFIDFKALPQGEARA